MFADTLYWGALLHPHDQYRNRVIRTRKMLGEVQADARVTVHPQSRQSFLAGLTFYERRSDEGITEVLTNDYHFAQEGFAALLR